MAIQPIDLQALFSQIDKVGKTQSVIREGQQIQDSLHQVQTQRKLEENVRSVNEAQDMGEEPAKVREDDKGKGAFASSGGKGMQEEDEEKDNSEENLHFIRDPALGKNIDITG